MKQKLILSIYDLKDIHEMLEQDMIDEYEEAFMRGYVCA
jgi:hypothetical protein